LWHFLKHNICKTKITRALLCGHKQNLTKYSLDIPANTQSQINNIDQQGMNNINSSQLELNGFLNAMANKKRKGNNKWNHLPQSRLDELMQEME
jgi:ABC-type Fe3+-citrate transport system substrate-binding protein